jgi:hypothetical protein
VKLKGNDLPIHRFNLFNETADVFGLRLYKQVSRIILDILCWKGRVKGRDWYYFVWFAANQPQLRLSHLEQRMIQSGHLRAGEILNKERFLDLAAKTIEKLDVDQVRREVEPFVREPEALAVWSKEFFLDVVKRVVFV